MADLSMEMSGALEEAGFVFSSRWHSFDCITCKNGCHTFADEDGHWCHVATLAELIEFVDGKAQLDTLTLTYAYRALRKQLKASATPGLRRRPRPYSINCEIVQFPQKPEQDDA